MLLHSTVGEEWESEENIIMLKCSFFWVRERGRESIMENYNVLLLLLKLD